MGTVLIIVTECVSEKWKIFSVFCGSFTADFYQSEYVTEIHLYANQLHIYVSERARQSPMLCIHVTGKPQTTRDMVSKLPC